MNLIDMHCDTIWKLMETNGTTLNDNPFCIDLQKLKRAESTAQFFACFIYLKQFEGNGRYTKGYDYAMQMLARIKQEIVQNKDAIAIARNFLEFDKNQAQGKLSAFVTIEEGGILDSQVNRLHTLYQEGVRLVTLLWNEENCIGSPNSKDRKIMQKGLKPFGFEVVEQMNALGMLIDVSHLSDGGFWDVLSTSSKPIVASHSNARALCEHPRNLTDDMIRALAEKGGVIGLNFYPYFVNPVGHASVSDLAEHALHLFYIGGEDAVAIGTDFDGFDDGKLELTDIGQIDRLYAELQKRGFTERQLEKIWSKNIFRIVKDVL